MDSPPRVADHNRFSDSALPAGSTPRLLTFRSGGWVLALAALLVLLVVAWRLNVMFRSMSTPVVGDGAHVATYGFDLSTCLVPREQLVAAGFPKDGLAQLAPRALTLAGADELTHQMREAHAGRFMVDKEAVIGVALNGQARAYPMRILAWHELLNDELGGVPIAVTYNPLCSAVVVFDRRVGGETLDFSVSGLLYNSNLLLYDRRPESTGESLWSQLQFRAIAGPAAERGACLTVLPVQVSRWVDWKTQHPDTTVQAPDMNLLKIYERSYGEYFGTDEPRFPVSPLPPHDRPYKTPIIAVRMAGCWHVFTWDQIAQHVGDDGAWATVLDGRPLRFVYRRDPALVGNPAAAWVEAGDNSALPPVAYSFWFAWYAMHPSAGPDATGPAYTPPHEP